MEKNTKSLIDYTSIMNDWLAAWNKADAELTASFYTDELDYRDPTVPQGIFKKEEFIKYLKLIFKVWPNQKWVARNIMPHASEGSFSADYEFKISNGRTTIQGCGMDRIEFKGNKVCLNHVYLNADQWKEWIKNELGKS